jgi:hypothetical protein
VLNDTFKGNLDTTSVSRLLDCKNHPDHLCGMKSKSTLAREFLDVVATSDEVMWPAFAGYHRSVAACTTDSQFDAMV